MQQQPRQPQNESSQLRIQTPHNPSITTWCFEGLTNGINHVVPSPYISNDLILLRKSQPICMRDESGNLVVRSIHEKDFPSEFDNPIVGRWQSGKTGLEVEIKQFGWHLIGLDYTIVIYGKRRTGKSHFISYLLYQLRPYFPNVIVFTKTKQNKFFQQYFPDSLILEDFDDALIDKLLDEQKLRRDWAEKFDQVPNYQCLFVFDDVLSAEKLTLRYSHCMNRMFFEGRHYGITIIVTIQDSKGIPPALKQNTDMSIMFPLQARRDRETIGDNMMPFCVNDEDIRGFMTSFAFKHQFIAVRNCRGSRPLYEEVFMGILSDDQDLPTFVMGSHICWKDNLDQLRQLGYQDLAATNKLEDWNLVAFLPPSPKRPKKMDGMFVKPMDLEPEDKDKADDSSSSSSSDEDETDWRRLLNGRLKKFKKKSKSHKKSKKHTR